MSFFFEVTTYRNGIDRSQKILAIIRRINAANGINFFKVSDKLSIIIKMCVYDGHQRALTGVLVFLTTCQTLGPVQLKIL